jgi:hypothetical protein
MNTIAGAVLTMVVIVMFQNYRRGTLRQWFAAKFLNQAPHGGADPPPRASTSPPTSEATPLPGPWTPFGDR